MCEASRKFYLLKPGSQGHWGRVPEVGEGSAGQCLALRGESSQVLKRDCRDNIFGKLEARWRARSPSAAGGSPGTWSRHSPRLCSTALGKVCTLILNQRGAQASSSNLGHRSPLPVLVVARVRRRSSGMGPTVGEEGGMEGSCGILPRRTKRGSSAGFLSEMSPNFGENFLLESCTKADVV